MRNCINSCSNYMLFVWFDSCISNIFDQQKWMSLLKRDSISSKLWNCRRFNNQFSVTHELLALLFKILVIIINIYLKVLFSMIKNILINMSAAEKLMYLVIKDLVNCIDESKFSISNKDRKNWDIFDFKKWLNILNNSFVKKISEYNKRLWWWKELWWWKIWSLTWSADQSI